MLISVRRALPSLRPAEQRVAQAVLADPAGISESSITAVARMCQTSETTVLRFCRAIGLAGYPELRIALARAAQFEETDAGGKPPVNGTIGPTDALAEVVTKITHADARAIEDTAATLGPEVLAGRDRRPARAHPGSTSTASGPAGWSASTCTRSCTALGWSPSCGPRRCWP